MVFAAAPDLPPSMIPRCSSFCERIVRCIVPAPQLDLSCGLKSVRSTPRQSTDQGIPGLTGRPRVAGKITSQNQHRTIRKPVSYSRGTGREADPQQSLVDSCPVANARYVYESIQRFANAVHLAVE